ncbi:UBA domain-containing protein [Caenorhabditis elegans]|nr:UBA domain-containing protein [Caenorhabditis elegans]CCW46007.1 UBA domain-containing protein [Caenorhabditis elegans]|eukprot:NP_001293493.1 Ubiquitin carboxyl-terminal hydrolase [Caenorhabditis elegans]
MPAGESANSPIDGDTAPLNVSNNESGDEGPRKRSASPATANQSSWGDNPAKKICTEGIDLWVQSTSEATAVPDVSQQYQDNQDMLITMGFKSEEIDTALRLSNNDVEKAIQYLTREISGLDSAPITASSSVEKSKYPLNDLVRNQFVESDEEDVAEEMRTVWDDASMARIKTILENNHKYVIFHQNGTLHRRLIVATNILRSGKHERMSEVLNFVDEFMSFIIGRHVNCSDVRPGFELLRQLLELQPPYIGEPEAHAIEQFYIAITPMLCARLTITPSSVKTVLAIDEMFNFRNKFFIQGVQYIDLPEREFPPLKYIDLERLERLEYKRIYAYLADVFVDALIPMIDEKVDAIGDEDTSEVTLLDLQCLLRALNIFSNFMHRGNDLFLCKLETWISKSLDRFRIVNDKEVRDALIRRQGLDLLQEIVILCDRFGLEVATTTQSARLNYLRKWIKCPQMESILHALEELGTIADRFHRTGGMTITRPKSHVNEEFFKKWLEENKVLQIVLTGNMDHVVYVERIQPILQYMTPELTFDDLKFVWSLRKGRMGVSVDNFNKIMEFISKSVNNEQIEWLIELFKKSFRSRETRLYEPIFNFSYTIAIQKDRDDECKLKICNVIWELIHIARGPPRCGSFKAIEHGMKKHCDLLGMMFDKSERDSFLTNMMDGLNVDEGFNEITVVYLFIMLDKLKRTFTPKRSTHGDETLSRVNELKASLRERKLADPLLDRLENIRHVAHERFEASLNANQDSQSNAVFESTNDVFGSHHVDNILTTSVYGCTDYGFVLQNTLRLLKWLHDVDASIVDVEYVQRLFKIFIEQSDSKPQEKTEIFGFLFEVRMVLMRPETSRAIITHLCGMDIFTLQITGLRCFCKYWEELPILSNEESRPVESFIVKLQKDNECKLFVWKLILFNQFDDVVEKCMETFCERDLVLVESPYSVRHHTYSFLSVFSFYVEKLKSELYKRSGKPLTEISYDTTELTMNEDEIKQHDVPLDGMLTETIVRALNRLVRFMTRFVELGNEKNHMIRENPSHGSSISGHAVTFNIELKNDDDDIDCGLNAWKTLICDSSTTVGEFKVRIAKRLHFHEGMTEFTVHKREDDLTMGEANLRYDFLTLQSVKLASETDSVFLSEKLRILVKPKKSSNRRSDLQNHQYSQKKALREDFLPMSIISKCNFYDLLHELASNGDKYIRASVRRLLLLLPTQPSILKQITFGDMDDDEDEPLTIKINNMCAEYMTPMEPGRMLYALEAISSVVAPTRLTAQATEDATELTNALLEIDVIKNLTDGVLTKPNVIPLNKCSPGDRHSIFERIIQIIRSVYTGRNTFIKMIRNEFRIREEMRKTCERMLQSRQTPRSIDQPMDYALTKQQIMPPPCVDNQNNPAYSSSGSVVQFKSLFSSYIKIITSFMQRWDLPDLIAFLESIRNFQWIHVATESLLTSEIEPFAETNQNKGKKTRETASDLIRAVVKGERWGDECRLIIVKKAFSLIRHMVREWVGSHGDIAAPLLETLFLNNSWVQFYQDVLVNSQQEAYRKYVQENIVKIGKDSFEITCVSLKMLLEMFMSLPLHDGFTSDLNELQRRQRQHCDGIVQTVVEIFYFESPRRCREDQKDIDWSQLGHKPIEIIRDQIKSLLGFKPRFCTTNNDLALTENIYAAAKMRMISCLLPYCSQSDIEDCSKAFIDAIINDFLFPELPDIEDSMFEEESIRWEYQAREAAIQTLNAFCERSYKNSHQLLNMWSKFMIAQKTYDPSYRPIIRGRQFDKVGMKNDGGTCYMNAMIQQLVHVPGLSRELIALQNIDPQLRWGDNTAALLCELQRVFAQLNFAQCQAIVPEGLWKEFRFEPDMPLNTKQHHDAIDFYSILLDKCDNVLKKLELPPLFQNRFFGKYSYEKICYGCWHRYKSPDEEFNCISLALSGDNLEEALENFLAAHVMEGENAYHCEKCDEKKTTLNRTSFLELPSTMTIQLKRFTYDLVNNMIRKDNQLFRFPFEIDMTPYMTTSRHVPDEHVQDLFDEMLYGNGEADEAPSPPHKNGVAEKPNLGSGSASTPSLESAQKKMFRRHRSSTMRLSQSFANTSGFDTPSQQKPLIYELVGVLAHSGIATAGHYYSFIKERREEFRDSPHYNKWHHINDMIVSPMSFNNIEDLWYGGTFTQEGVFIGLDERVRHWNAYVLFYEKKRDEPTALIPRHIIDRLNDVKPKVTFDVSDEIMDDGEDKMKAVQDALKKDMSEARKLRIRMFNSMDLKMKKFLNDDYCKFLDDRDFFSFDLYQIYINSLLPLLKREETVEYTVTDLDKADFFKLAFEYIASYIIRVAWMMFDEHRPKNFPRAATDLIRLLLLRHPDNKMFFFKSLEANNSEMLTRMLETTEHDIRASFWHCMRSALRLWVLENGNKDENMMEPSPDSTDLDDDDEEDDEDDEDDDLEDEDSETEEMFRQDMMRPSPMALVSQLVMNQSRPPQLKPMLPVDLSKARSQRLNIVRRIVQVLPFRIHRMEGSGRHYSRSLVEMLYMISRLNEFGKSVLHVCNALQLVGEFLWEDYSTVFCRLRFSEDRIKGLGLWPYLPGLYFELLLDTMNRSLLHIIDPHLHYRHLLMTTQGKFMNESLALYCASREEHETTEGKSVNDEKSLHSRIVLCYVRQIQLIVRSEVPDAAQEYIFNACQILLKAFLKDVQYMFTSIEHWSHVIDFFIDLAQRLVRVDLSSLGACLLKNLMWVGIAEDDDTVEPGVLPVMLEWKETDYTKYRKMNEALFNIRIIKHPELRAVLLRCSKRFRSIFKMSYAENDIDSDEPMDESDEVMIGPQLLKRATNSTDLTRSAVPSACATARVIETKEINLEEDLKANLSAASLEMTEQPSLEEVLSVDSSEEDISMIALSENPGAEDNEK